MFSPGQRRGPHNLTVDSYNKQKAYTKDSQRQLAACQSGELQPQTSAPGRLRSDRYVWISGRKLSSVTARTLTSAKRSLLNTAAVTDSIRVILFGSFYIKQLHDLFSEL